MVKNIDLLKLGVVLSFDDLILAQNDSILQQHLLNVTPSSKRILFATSIASFDHGINFDKLIALSLHMRGHNVEFMFCDSSIPICQVIKYENFQPNTLLNRNDTPRCSKCIKKIPNLKDLPFAKIHHFSDFNSNLNDFAIDASKLNDLSLNQIMDLDIDGVRIGPQIRAGVVRYFANPSFEDESLTLEIARKYANAAIKTWNVYKNYIGKYAPDVIVAHHGIYVPQGIVALIASHMNVKLVTWNPSYRKGTFIFSHDESYHYSMIKENNDRWENMNLNSENYIKIRKYLKSRESGRKDWIKFTDSMPKINILQQFRKLVTQKNRFSKSRNYRFGLLTNVAWDADLHFENKTFSSMNDWLIQTVKFFISNPEIDLVIRVHPAESLGNVKSRQKVTDVISQNFKNLTRNIKIIDSLDPINTYQIMNECDSIIIYGTKAGIEFSFRGKNVVVCGESWIKGKGIGTDIRNQQEYFEQLKVIARKRIVKIDDVKLDRAKKYAYHFFFKRMIYLPFFKLNPVTNKSNIEVNDVMDLTHGKNQNLDTICDGIIFKSVFEAVDIGPY